MNTYIQNQGREICPVTYNPISDRIKYLIGSDDVQDKSLYAWDRRYRIMRYCNQLRSILFQDADMYLENWNDIDFAPNAQKCIGKLARLGCAITKQQNLWETITAIDVWIYGFLQKIATDFPEPCRFQIKTLLNLPHGETAQGVQVALATYENSIDKYPEGLYINWDWSVDLNIESDEMLIDTLNYRTTLKREQPVFDSSTIFVDCENSNPQRLWSFVLQTSPKTTKIVLVDDAHTTVLWKAFSLELQRKGYKVVHEVVERVKELKSLVDMRLMALACQEYYQNNQRQFIIASSDSDMFSLIKSLPDAKFGVALERSKSCDELLSALQMSQVRYWFLDKGECDGEFERIAVRAILENYFEQNKLDVRTIIQNAYGQVTEEIGNEAISLCSRLICVKDGNDMIKMSFAEEVTTSGNTFKPERILPAGLKKSYPAKPTKKKRK